MLKGIVIRHCTDIPRMVLETAHWNGLIKKIFTKGGIRKKISENSKEEIYEVTIPKGVRGDHYIRDNWTSNEEMINETLNSILMMLPPTSLASLISEVFDIAVESPLYLVDIEWDKDISVVIGHPDIVISDRKGENFFLIELKIQAKKTNGKFSLQQHRKYSNLAQLLELNGKNVNLALLSPSLDPIDTIEPRERMWFDFHNDTLIPVIERIDGKPTNVSNKGVVNYQSYIEYQNKNNAKFNLEFKVFPDKYTEFRYINFPRFYNSIINVAPHLDEPLQILQQYCSK